jgi:hypothetical protein
VTRSGSQSNLARATSALERVRARAVEPVPSEPASVEEALSLGQIDPKDVPGADELGNWSREGSSSLLPPPVPGERDGSVETNLVRKGMFFPGRERQATSSEQMVLRFLATRDRLGEISRVDSAGPNLTEVEFQVMVAVCTVWRTMANPFAIRVPLSLAAISRELGWSIGGKGHQRIMEALSALKQATFAGRIYDAQTQRLDYVHEFGLIQEWAVGSRSEPGRIGEVGFVEITNWLRRQLAANHQTYFSRALMRRLRRPVAKMLLPWLESERFETRTPEGTWVKDWPVDAKLFTAVGITDSRERRGRETLRRAGEEIVSRDEGARWVRIEILPAGRRGCWIMRAERAAN